MKKNIKKSIKVQKINKKDLVGVLNEYLSRGNSGAGVIRGEVKHLELAVRSLNLQRSP